MGDTSLDERTLLDCHCLVWEEHSGLRYLECLLQVCRRFADTQGNKTFYLSLV
jgi:hypothetical protein